MILVADASAAAKLVIGEAGSDVVHRLWDGPAIWLAPTLIVPEVASAITAANGAGRLPGAAVGDVHAEWRSLSTDIQLRTVDAGLAAAAGAVAESRTVRGADAVYVALALAVAEQTDAVLASFDHRQRGAALETGLMVVPAAL